MATGVIGNSARTYPWQVTHYIVRGGPNDPVIATTPAPPATPTGSGSLSWNSAITLPPIPGQSANRTMTLLSAGTLAAGQLTGNTGGIYIGTIPKGAVILDAMLTCYAVLAGGTATSAGIFYTSSDSTTVYPVPTLNLIASIVTPSAATQYRLVTAPPAAVFTTLAAAPGPTGFGNPTVAGAATNLASLTDIDIYVAAFLIAGGAAGPQTGGCFGCMIQFTGLEG